MDSPAGHFSFHGFGVDAMKSIQSVCKLVVAVFAVLFLAISCPTPAHAEDGGASGEGEAKPVYRVAIISTEWCAPCQKLKAALRNDPALKEFSAAEIFDGDEPAGKSKMKEVGCRVVPAIIAVHSTKRAILIQTGYDGDAKGLLARLRAKLKAINDAQR